MPGQLENLFFFFFHRDHLLSSPEFHNTFSVRGQPSFINQAFVLVNAATFVPNKDIFMALH